MPGPIEAAGAVKNPSKYGALSMGARQFTGLWTQRSPYRDAAVQYLVSKFYSGSRFDSIIDGINREIGMKMTDVRRPGSVVYNPNVFPSVVSYATWKWIQNTNEIVRVILDGADGVIYDATAGQKTALFTKSAGAGATQFLSIDTELFFCDGVDQQKILRSGLTWAPETTFTVGDFIIDTNGNIQSFQSQATALTINTIEIVTIPVGLIMQNFLVFTVNGLVPTIPSNQPITFSGITASGFTFLNGTTINYANLAPGWNLNLSTSQFALMTSIALTPAATTPGTAATFIQVDDNGNDLTGVTGATEPDWSTEHGAITQDGAVGTGVTWMCFGSPVQNWGVTSAPSAPTLTPGPTAQYWSAGLNLLALPQFGFAIIDANGSLEVPFGVGITGTEQPIWNTTLGGKTTDGTVVWMNVGQVQTWFPNFQFSTTITAIIDPVGNLQLTTDFFTTQTIFVDGVGNTTGAGNTTGTTQPGAVVPAQSRGSSYYLQSEAVGDDSNPGTNVTVYYSDSTLAGPDPNLVNAFNAFLAGGPPVTLNFSFTGIPEPIGPENVMVTGIGEASPPGQPRQFFYFTFTTDSSALIYFVGAGNPQFTANYVGVNDETTWNPTLGGKTIDNAYTWINCGPATQLTAGTLQYAQCYHSIDGTVSTASPVSFVLNPMVGAPGMFGVNVALVPSGDPQVDQIFIMRTAGGQPTLVFADEIPNVGPNATFNYMDVIPDTSTSGQQALDPEIPAPVDDTADPPPAGISAPIFALGRTWAIVGNAVQYSAGPDAVTGNGNTQWPPENTIPYVARPVRMIPVTVQNGGILVFTTDGVYIILGTGTAANPFSTTVYYASVSITGYNAVSVYNNAVFVMESNHKVSTLAIEFPFNPQTGYTEIGFPIGDQLEFVTTGGFNAALFDPATAFVSWNIQSSKENAMYVSDGAGHWFRLSAVPQPETGWLWSPLAAIEGGASAVQSIETSPGTYQLLLGPPVGTTGPILARDSTGTVFTDNGTPYPSFDVKGVNILCSTGQWAEVVHISAKSAPVGARPTVSVLVGEIAASIQRPYTVLKLDDKSNDPARTPRSISVFSDRYVLKQSGANTLGDCLLTRFDYGTQAVADELLDWGIYARVHEEREEEVAPQR
jgi:hypothetical protein